MENKELQLAWELVQNTGCNIFLTGKAGTGKTTFLKRLREETFKRCIVLAPTGIAAINAGGSTLHSFFQLPFGPYIPGTELRSEFKFSDKKRRLIRSLDLVIIDEISMVRADLLDSVDAALRRYRDRNKPFGGVQLLMIGDLQQLSPVAKPEEWEILKSHYDTQYFFSSNALKMTGFVTVELRTVYRQSDQHFIDLLNKVRNNQVDATVISELNSRYQPNFNPSPEEGYIRLTTHNWQADRINDEKLRELPTPAQEYKAEIWHEFPELSYPTAETLTLKVGAQVMFVKNDSTPAKRYYNGMIGTVVDLGESIIKVRVEEHEKPIEVTTEQWENTRYQINEETKAIEEELLGTFTQFPLKTAWAITVHKSQGLTFERAIIDVQHSFTHGQTYVALSRCKSLQGMVLSTMIPPRAIISDQKVVDFTNSIPQQIPSPQAVEDMHRAYFLSLVAELFTFQPIRFCFDAYLRHVDEYFYKQNPDALHRWKQQRLAYEEKVEKVAATFARQYQSIVLTDYEYAKNPLLQERIKKGAAYFVEHIRALRDLLQTLAFVTNNKAVKERYDELKAEFAEQIRQKIILLNLATVQGFDQIAFQRERALVMMGEEEKKTKGKSKAKNAKTPKNQKNPKVTAFEALKELENDYNSYVSDDLSNFDDVDFPDLNHDGLPY